MPADAILTAEITAGVSILTTLVTLGAARALERYKSTLALQQAEAQARRDYEYEARKTLYTQTEPILFQFYESASYALNRLTNLARASRDGNLDGPGSWMHDSYYRLSLVHSLLTPLAILHVFRQRVTLLDLTLDSRIERQYELGKALNRALSRDFDFAKGPPQIPYTPNTDPAPRETGVTDARYVRQGVVSGRLQRASAALLLGDPPSQRPKTYAEFEKEFNAKGTTLRDDVSPLLDLFDNFSPTTMPVLWRILIAQVFILRAIRLYRVNSLNPHQILERVRLTPEEKLQFAFSQLPAHQEAINDAYDIGLAYLKSTLDYDTNTVSALPST